MNSLFWAVRFSILSVSASTSAAGILLITFSRGKLHESMPVRYVLAISSCQFVMALLALTMGVIGLEGGLQGQQTC